MTKRPQKRSNRQAAQRADRRLSRDDVPELRQARALWVKQRLRESLAMFERAVRLYPHHALALADASRAFGAAYQFERAEALVDRLADSGKDDGELLHLAAQSYRLIRRPEKALDCFRAALAAATPHPDSYLELAVLLERRNQLENALRYVDARLARQPGDPEGRTVKGRILRRQGEVEQAESLLRTAAQDRNAHWLTRMRAWAELAALFNAQAAYREAWDAMLAGKKIATHRSAAARQHRDKMIPPLVALAEQITAEDIPRWRQADGGQDDPPGLALLTGLPRSGTTLMQRVLDAHPQILSCDELDAFPRFIFPALLRGTPIDRITADLFRELPSEYAAAQRDLYRRLLEDAIGEAMQGRLLLDKNPSLLPLVPAYLRMAPRGRLLVVLRDPRDCLVSCLMSYFPLNDFSVDFLTLDSAAQRLTGDLNIWLSLRDKIPDRWIEVRYESLVQELPSTMKRVVNQLGLPWDEQVLSYRDITAQRQVNSPSYDTVSQPIYTRAIGRWKHYAERLAPVLPQLDPVLAAFGWDA